MKVILFTTVAIALFALPVFADDKSENTIAVQETVLQHYFSNDTEEYNEAAERLFHKLDVNEDEQINTTDLDQLEADTKANALLGDMFGDTAAAGGSIKTWVMSFDKNGDNSVSQQEFTDGMGQYQNQVITVEMSLCDGAKEIVENCRSKEPSVMTVSKLAEKMQCAMCKVGLASFRGNPIQKCIKQNAGSCSAVNACFSSDDKDSTSSSSALKRRALMRRDANEDSIRMWFWVSMIILAIPAFASVIGIPFYIIAVYIASKHMSLNTN